MVAHPDYDAPMDQATVFDAEIIRRYDRPGPRYTSYPTAPRFSPQFTGKDLLDVIAQSNEDPIPRALSLYAHIPFCFSPCFYCGCNRIISRDAAKKQHYLEALLKEIRMMAPLFDKDREVVQLHLGGGTPNSLDTHQLSELMQEFARNFRFAAESEREFSIEIDPRTVDIKDIATLRAIGFSRVSFGIQDFDPHVQQAINRLQDTARIADLFKACKTAGFESINFDLIYGLPKQTTETFATTLATVAGMRPDRIALYGYAHMPELFKAQNRINAATLPDSEHKLALFHLAVETLMAEGYVYIGMDHFALPCDELTKAQANGDLHRNFMGYTTRKQTDLIGFGVSSISQIGDCYAQNEKTLPDWLARVQSEKPSAVRGLRMTHDDRIRADVIQAIMCQGRLCFADIEHRYGIVFTDYFQGELRQLAALADDGLITLGDTMLSALPRGRLLLRVIASRFDAYLPNVLVSAEPGRLAG
jgi:oxygen-independent coproporphyrinogen-3 oxidase